MARLTVVDTDILIDAGRGINEAIDYLQELERSTRLAVSVVRQMELIIGCRNKAELRALEQFLRRFRILKINETISDKAVELLQRYRLSHGLLIADALLGVTLQGRPFKHWLIHSVLPYSNWEWGRIARSESLAAVQLGLQSTLFKLGYVPQYHQTDNSSAATRCQGIYEQAAGDQARPCTDGYLHWLDHCGLAPRVIHIGNPNENGDIEAANGSFKRALEQHLLLREHRDFDSLDDYEQFLFGVMDKRNHLRQERFNEAIAVMKPLSASNGGPHAGGRCRAGTGTAAGEQPAILSRRCDPTVAAGTDSRAPGGARERGAGTLRPTLARRPVNHVSHGSLAFTLQSLALADHQPPFSEPLLQVLPPTPLHGQVSGWLG